ncbi:hypothetical protein ACQ4PT_053720 [Festuca glaucescens]
MISPDVFCFCNIFGVVGNVISVGLFLSPVPTFRKIIKNKSVQEYRPVPYLAALLNCTLWAFYALPFVRPNNMLVLTVNGIGLLIEAIYVGIFLVLAHNKERLRMLIVLGIEAVFMVALVLGVLLGAHTRAMRSMIVGILCVTASTAMYASPLNIIKRVVHTKSVEYMAFFPSLMGLLNGACWTAYALIKFDTYVMIPSGLAVLFSLVQLILYLCYHNSTPKKEKKVELPIEEQSMRDAKFDKALLKFYMSNKVKQLKRKLTSSRVDKFKKQKSEIREPAVFTRYSGKYFCSVAKSLTPHQVNVLHNFGVDCFLKFEKTDVPLRLQPSSEYMHIFSNPESFMKYDLSKFVYDWLLMSIKKFRRATKNAARRQITLGGNHYSLAVACLDNVDFDLKSLPSIVPRVLVWKDVDFDVSKGKLASGKYQKIGIGLNSGGSGFLSNPDPIRVCLDNTFVNPSYCPSNENKMFFISNNHVDLTSPVCQKDQLFVIEDSPKQDNLSNELEITRETNFAQRCSSLSKQANDAYNKLVFLTSSSKNVDNSQANHQKQQQEFIVISSQEKQRHEVVCTQERPSAQDLNQKYSFSGCSTQSNGVFVPRRFTMPGKYNSDPYVSMQATCFPLLPSEICDYSAICSIGNHSVWKKYEAVKYEKAYCSFESLATLQPFGHIDTYLVLVYCRKLFMDSHPKYSKKHTFFSYIGETFLKYNGNNGDIVQTAFQGANLAFPMWRANRLPFPICLYEHWFVFVVCFKAKLFAFCDSLYGADSSFHQNIDNVLMQNFVHLWNILVTPVMGRSINFNEFQVIHPYVP